MQVEYVKELDSRVIYVQSIGDGYTVVECERMAGGNVNPIPVRMMVCKKLQKALEVAEKWAGIS